MFTPYRRKFFGRLLLVGLLISLPCGPGPAVAQSAHTQTAAKSICNTKVPQLLAASTYKFKSASETVWTIPFTGTSLKDYQVILATNEDLLVIFVIVAKKSQMNVTPEFMGKLLRLNHSLDRVKVGLDDDSDLFVRTDTSCRVLDAGEMHDQIEQVAAAANEVHQNVKSTITATP